MNETQLTIAEHYDPGAVIDWDDDPLTMFDQWKEFAEDDPEWRGDEFTLDNVEFVAEFGDRSFLDVVYQFRS